MLLLHPVLQGYGHKQSAGYLFFLPAALSVFPASYLWLLPYNQPLFLPVFIRYLCSNVRFSDLLCFLLPRTTHAGQQFSIFQRAFLPEKPHNKSSFHVTGKPFVPLSAAPLPVSPPPGSVELPFRHTQVRQKSDEYFLFCDPPEAPEALPSRFYKSRYIPTPLYPCRNNRPHFFLREFIHFYFALQGGSNRLEGFTLHFSGCPLFQSIKRKGFRQVIESTEILYFKHFSHICLERIVSKCGFTYP